MRELAPRHVTREATGEQDADEDRRDLEQHDPDRRARFIVNAPRRQVADDDGKRTDADRAVMRGERRGIGSRQAADVPCDQEGGQRQREADCHHAGQLEQRHAPGVAGELDAALEPDRKQQHGGHELVDRARQAQVRPRQAGDEAHDEEQDDRIDGRHLRLHAATRLR